MPVVRRMAAALGATLALCAPATALAAPGDLDPAFGSGGKLTLAVGPGSANLTAAVHQPDGKLVVAGFAERQVGSDRDFLVARLTATGALDPSFNPGGPTPGVVTTPVGAGTADDEARAVALGSGGTIYAVGTTDPPAQFADLAIVRYTAAGAVDGDFSGDGIQLHDTGSVEAAAAAAVQPDGKLLIAGQHGSTEGGMLVARLDPATGALDSTFNGTGVREIVFTAGFGGDRASALALQPDGKIVVAGTANLSSADDDVAVARVTASGDLDTAGFGAGTGMARSGPAKDQALALALAPDGKLVVAGNSSPSAGVLDFLLARFTTDGSPDAAFSGDGFATTPFTAADGTRFAGATAVAIQPDGRILSAGSAFTCSRAGCADFAVARHDDIGNLDGGFGARTHDVGGANDFATAALLGSLVVFGFSFDGTREVLSAAAVSTNATGGSPPPPPPGVTPSPQPKLEVIKTARALLGDAGRRRPPTISSVAPGQDYLYEVDVKNPGDVTLEDVVVSDTIVGPARGRPGEADVYAVLGDKTVGKGVPCPLAGRRKGFRCELGRMGSGEVRRVRFIVRVDGRATGEIDNTADATGVAAGRTIRATDEVKLEVERPFTGNVFIDLTRVYPFITGEAGIRDGRGARALQVPRRSRLRRVEIALLRNSRTAPRRCLWLANRRARFRRVRSLGGRTCDRPIWLRARGTRRWRFALRRPLPAGRYVLVARATTVNGAVESIFTKRRGNRLDFTLRRR